MTDISLAYSQIVRNHGGNAAKLLRARAKGDDQWEEKISEVVGFITTGFQQQQPPCSRPTCSHLQQPPPPGIGKQQQQQQQQR